MHLGNTRKSHIFSIFHSISPVATDGDFKTGSTKMTLKKFQEACIFNLNEKKPSGEFKYKKVKSCIDSTMKKYSLGKEILGFTMCVRDKPIGLSLIETKAHLTVRYSVVQAVRRPCDWYLSSEIIPGRVFSFKLKKYRLI